MIKQSLAVESQKNVIEEFKMFKLLYKIASVEYIQNWA